MRRFSSILAAVLLLSACKAPEQALYERLIALSDNHRIAYGHQDDLAYGHSWRVEDWENDSLERSDIKDVCGKYPLVLGLEIGGIELGDSCNLDGVPFGLIRKAARLHTERGGIVTLSWHPRNPVTGESTWDVGDGTAVRAILPGGEKHVPVLHLSSS